MVEAVGDGRAAVEAASRFDPDLIVLDLNLLVLDGLDVCRQVRSRSSVPILVLSVRADEGDRVDALDHGADDHLAKPFGIEEPLARVRALLRRSGAHDAPRPKQFRLGAVDIDLSAHTVRLAGQDVRLTRTEWALLETLAEHPGRLLTHRWILEQVWGPGYGEDLGVLRVFVSQLRKKIEPDPDRASIILTDPGVGYRWVLRPTEERTEERERERERISLGRYFWPRATLRLVAPLPTPNFRVTVAAATIGADAGPCRQTR